MSVYFDFTPEEKSYLNGINENYDGNLSPFAARNDAAVRVGEYRYNIIRPPYSYDIDQILHSPIYNRYTDKTQVFSFYKNDDLTRRALHVLFVSKIARTIGRALRLNLDLIEAIALGHDLGHTPFGHKGEEYLSECYSRGCQQSTGVPRYFNHNVHSTKLLYRILDTKISLQTLSGVLSHNGEKVCKEYGPSDLSDFSEFEKILENCYKEEKYHKKLHPNTLEGCVVRISDMIAYAGKDRQDLSRLGLVPNEEFKSERLIGESNSDIISNLIANIIKNSIERPYLSMDREVFDDMKDLISENNKIIYQDPRVTEPYDSLIKPLMSDLYARLMDDVKNENETSPIYRHYLRTVMGKSYTDPETRALIVDPNEVVTDFIASMTDDYFVDICRYLHINDEILSQIRYHEYFD